MSSSQCGTVSLLSGSINHAGSELDPDFQTCHASKNGDSG